MLTRSGWALIAASLVGVAVGRAFGLVELFVIGATGLAVVTVALVGALRPLPNLEIERVIRPGRVPRSGAARVELSVRNVGPRPTPVLGLIDPVEGTVGARVSLPPLGAGQHQGASYRLPTDRRGLVRVGPLEASRTDPFGLTRHRSTVAAEATLVVLPHIDFLPGVAAGGGLDDPLAGISHPVLGGRGEEDFSTLRPYVIGDDLRRVHWASSARHGDLLVRLDDPPWRGHITVLLDGREDRIDAAAFELAVSAAASLVHAAAQQGQRVRLVLADGTDSGLIDGHLRTDGVLDQLALVDRHRAGPLPDVGPSGRARSGGLVVVTGRLEADEIAHLARHPERFATVRVVLVGTEAADLSGTRPDLRPGLPGGARVEVVRVDRTHRFPEAWAAARGGTTPR